MNLIRTDQIDNLSGYILTYITNNETVTTLKTGSNTPIKGNITFTAGTNLSIVQSGQTFTFNNTYTLPSATTSILGGVKLFSDSTQTVASNAVTTTASRTYGVQTNSAGQLVVNVPWTDTTYSAGTLAEIEANNTNSRLWTGAVLNSKFAKYLPLTGGTLTNTLKIVNGTTTTGWQNNTVNDANNFIQNNILALTTNNQGLHFFGDYTLNARRMGIQSSHASTGYANTPGILELNPFGGEVRIGSGGLNINGSLKFNNGLSIESQMADGSIKHFKNYSTNLYNNTVSGTYASYQTLTSKVTTFTGTTLTLTHKSSTTLTVSSTGVNTVVNKIYSITGYVKINGVIPTAEIWTATPITSQGGGASIKNYYDETTGYFECVHQYKSATGWLIHKSISTLVVGDVITLENLTFVEDITPIYWKLGLLDLKYLIENTYTAGNGLTLSGNAFSLPVTDSGSGNYVTNVVASTNGLTVTKATLPTPALVTNTTATGVTNVATTNTNTYLNVTQGGASPGSSTQITGAGSVTVSSDTVGKLTITGTDTNTTYYSGTTDMLTTGTDTTARLWAVSVLNSYLDNTLSLNSSKKVTLFSSQMTDKNIIRVNLMEAGAAFSGYLKISVTSSYTNQNANGVIILEGGMGLNASGSTLWNNQLTCTLAQGNTVDVFYVDPVIKFETATRQPYIEIHKKYTNGNIVECIIEYNRVSAGIYNPTPSLIVTDVLTTTTLSNQQTINTGLTVNGPDYNVLTLNRTTSNGVAINITNKDKTLGSLTYDASNVFRVMSGTTESIRADASGIVSAAFKKTGSSASYMLLGDGSHKLLSDFTETAGTTWFTKSLSPVGSYISFVIPLFEYEENAQNGAKGHINANFHFRRSNGLTGLTDNVRVIGGDTWENTPHVMFESTNTTLTLVSFTWNAKKYIGIRWIGGASHDRAIKGYGFAQDESIIQRISYANSNTGEVLNAEINSSIAEYTPTVVKINKLNYHQSIKTLTVDNSISFSQNDGSFIDNLGNTRLRFAAGGTVISGNSNSIYFRPSDTSSTQVTIDASANISATTFKKIGGTSSQFLKADGSVDSTAYTTDAKAKAALVTNTSATGVTNVATTNTNTYLNVTQNGASPGSSTQVTGAGSVTVASDTAGKLTITGTNTTYTAGSGLTLSGTAFSLPVTQSGSGNAVTAVTQGTNGITVTKGSTFSLDGHTHDSIVGKVWGSTSSDVNTDLVNTVASRVTWHSNINKDTPNLFPNTNNANGILHLATHQLDHWHQLGFSSDKNLYHRYQNGLWSQIITDKDLTRLNDSNHMNYYFLVSVNTASPLPFQDYDGTNLTAYDSNKTYPAFEVSMNVTATGTVTGTKYILYINSNTWSVIKIGNATDTSSNHPVLFVDTDGIPKIKMASHATKYPVACFVRRLNVLNNVFNVKRLFGLTFDSLLDTPTTLGGYGITDGMSTSHAANGVTSTLISNWNTAYSNNHTHSNKTFLDAVNQNLGTTNTPTFANINTGIVNGNLGYNQNSLQTLTNGTFGGFLQTTTNGPINGTWYNIIKMLHNNSAGYYTELAQSFNGVEGLYYRRMNNGVLGSWQEVATTTSSRASLVTSTSATGVSNVATTNTNTYLNVTQNGASPGSSTQVTGAGSVTVASDTAGKLTITGTNTTYTAGNGITLSGTAFSLPVTQSGSGNAVTAVTQDTNGITITKGDTFIKKLEPVVGVIAAVYSNASLASTQKSKLRITLPFKANAGIMLGFTIRLYGTYRYMDIQCSGYLYSSPNNWLYPSATVSHDIGNNIGGNFDVTFGRDEDGYAYVTIPNFDYIGVAVLNVVRGYSSSMNSPIVSTIDWSITQNEDTPNISLTVNTGIRESIPVATTSLKGLVKVGTNLSIASDGTLSSVNTNTTYTAGNGLTLSGTAFSLPVTDSGSGNYVTNVVASTNGLTVTKATLPTPALVTNTTATGVTNVATTNTNTYLNVTQGGASPGSSTQVTGAGSVTVSSDTAGKLTITGTNQTLSFSDGRLTLSSGNSVDLNFLRFSDTRSVNETPNSYNNGLKFLGIKTNTVIGISNESSYSAVLGLRGWNDSSGGAAFEFAFGGNGGMYMRYGATTSWSVWQQMITTNHITTSQISSIISNNHTHSNKSQLDTINQSLGTSNSPTFNKLNLSSTGSSWLSGHMSNASILLSEQTSNSSYYSWMRQVFSDGSGVSIGTLGQTFYFSFATEADLTAGNNNTTKVVAINKSGLTVVGSIAKSGGTSSQFLKADGSVDSNAYTTLTETQARASLVTSTSATGITNVATTNTNTYLNVTQNGASPGSSTQVTGAGSVTVASDTAGKLTITGTNTTYTAGSGLTLSGTAFSLPVTQSGSGNAVTAVTQDTNGITVTKGSTFSLDGHTHTFASLTSKPTTLSGYGITDAGITGAVTNTATSTTDVASTSNGSTFINRMQGGVIKESVKFVGAGSVSITHATGGIITVTGSNTTYTAGNGLTLSGTAFSLPVTDSGSGNYVTNVVASTNGLTVTKATLPTPALVTNTSATGVTNVATTNTNTYLNVTQNGASPGSSTQITGAGSITVASNTAGKLTITGTDTTYDSGTTDDLEGGGDGNDKVWIAKVLTGFFFPYTGGYLTGSVYAPAFYETSLRKYKTNILEFNLSGIELVNSLDIVTFDRIESDSQTPIKNKIGVIADDTRKEFLSENKDAVDLYKTTFIQAKAIQELNLEIKDLREKNEVLENEMREIKELLKKLLK